MGRIKDLTISSLASISITALVLETNFNPASLANAAGAGCKTQKGILMEYVPIKKDYAFLKYLVLGKNKNLDDFDEWAQDIGSYLLGCYMKEHMEKYGKNVKTIGA